MRNTTFLINGGAGRVINSIPALEKYERLNPNDDFRVIVHGWECVFWSHPTLQKRVFGYQKGNFETLIKDNNVRSPEPYLLYNFFNQNCNLIEAFDECINNTTDHTDLNYNCLYLSDFEIELSNDLINFHKERIKKERTIVFQPFGSGVRQINKKAVDPSNRSFSLDHYFKIVKKLNNDALILYASQPELRHPQDNFSVSFDDQKPYLRAMMGLISQCDYYVGVCSVGQHIARAFNKPGLVVMGGTNESNFSYNDHFTIIRKKNIQPVYAPWRVSDIDVEFSDRMNNGAMNFTDDEIEEILLAIKENLKSNKNNILTNETLTFTSNYS